MSQLERSEKARGESEARAGDYLKSLNDLKEASEKHNSVRDKLQVRQRWPDAPEIKAKISKVMYAVGLVN